PSRRQAEYAERAEEDRCPEHAPVDRDGLAGAGGEPQHEATERKDQVDGSRNAAPAVVGELVRTDELAGVQVVGKGVADLARLACSHIAITRLAGHRSQATDWKALSATPR